MSLLLLAGRVASGGERFGSRDAVDCSFCGQRFSKPYDVKKHIRTVHKHYGAISCKNCRRTYSKVGNFKIHLKTCKKLLPNNSTCALSSSVFMEYRFN